MKLLVLNYEYPPLGGGAGVITQHISEGLAKLGHEICVVTTGMSDLPEESSTENLQIIRLPSKRKYIYRSNPREMYSWMRHANKFLKQHLKEENYDLCFANFSIPGGAVAYKQLLRFGLNYTIISHGHDIPWFFPKQMLWYHLFLYHTIKNIALNSKINFVQSDEMKRNIDLFTGKEFASKNKIVYNGWDGTVFAPDYSKRSPEFTILFIGRLVKQKDPFTFLKAINKINGKIPFKVNILGDGSLRNKMERYIATNNLSDKVKFFGWLSKDEVLNHYQSASITVLPSLAEGMSIATLEALACGQYVIATKLSNNETLINEGINGNLIDIGDFNKLSELVLDYYNT
ncbi:MAG: glycosyltransferase family 4 protein, partial [Bacteroidales bacterium]|nr:glycosyltransferase family 4 protein [Bacteroidales bacterium]